MAKDIDKEMAKSIGIKLIYWIGCSNLRHAQRRTYYAGCGG
ncbi:MULTISPECIES: hypothetical protein [unclassified Blautia]